MKDILIRGLREMGVTPPAGAVDKLCRYGELLLEQNQVMNLTAITQPEDVVRLHFLDSATVLTWGNRRAGVSRPTASGRAEVPEDTAGVCPRPAASPAGSGEIGFTWLNGKTLVDVGTGAGFPGMVLKLLEPSLSLTLVDSLGKRLAWLETVCKALSLDNVRCIHARAEELALDPEFRDRFDVATSRAVAAYPALCELCLPYVKPGGVFLAMKSLESGPEVAGGQNADKRLGGNPKDCLHYPNPDTGVTHQLDAVQKVSPTPKGFPRAWGKIKKSPL